MSRSRKKHRIIGHSAESDKRDKVLAHRRIRRAVRVSLHIGSDHLPQTRDMSNPWFYDKDGKTAYRNQDRLDPKWSRK
jgi:hypothetical protein